MRSVVSLGVTAPLVADDDAVRHQVAAASLLRAAAAMPELVYLAGRT